MQKPHALTMGIDHLGLTVSDLDLTCRFFVDGLGWKVVGERPSYPAVFVSDGHQTLTLWQADKSDGRMPFDRRKNVGLHHVAFKVESLARLESLYARVSAWPGVVVEFAPQLLGAGPSMHCIVHEPGGLRIEFIFTPKARSMP
ncbi:MAG TPA: VOC family protein [Dyella sp.]|uniref:VOC family protein n=1 Tax=Dyella sp. TaxID=1869338 RepID=UPI002C0A2C5F|nr:VOC family protein [Dyella sp.]HTV85291.1 VOC family protein [Dyella sp.]